MKDRIFHCDRCGICCTKLKLSNIYSELDSGNGICKFFDMSTKLCTIYENRPEICDVKAMYKYFKNMMTFNEYILSNERCCKRLKEM